MKYMVTLNGKKYEIEVEEGQGNRQQRYNRPMQALRLPLPRGSSRPVAAPAALPCPCPALPLHPLRLPLRQMAQTLCAQCPARFRRKGIGWSGC